MHCPCCNYESPFTVVRCPRCAAAFDAEQLEELGHLSYLQTWLLERRMAGAVPWRAATSLLEDVDERTRALETALGLRAPVAPAPAPVVVMEAPVAAAVAPAPVAQPVPAPVAPMPAPPPPPPRVVAPARPVFSWAQVGTYLLSERTLHALLGLGALLILASGVVISTLNPTGLGPLLHLAAVLCTTLLFYTAGYAVRQRLRLALTGAALLGIGGAFIPLSVWTLGQEMLRWEPGATWLLASTLCLPLYVASHAVLRDRTFAVLVVVSGGSEALALVHWLGVPLEWGLLLLVGLGCAYVWLGRWLGAQWRILTWALAWAAQIAVPAAMVALLGARFFPGAWEDVARQPLGPWYEYAIGSAWWLGAGFFALAWSRLHRRYLRTLAIWTVPVAYLLTLTKAPWEAAWHGVALAALAGAYLLYGYLRVTDAGRSYRSVAREPVYQAAFSLSVLAAAWPARVAESEIATLVVLAVVYGAAAMLLRQRAWAYVSVYLVPIAWGLLLDRLAVAPAFLSLAWSVLAVALLVGAEVAVRRTAEARRPLVETVVGDGPWRSRFGSPLFSAGYVVSALALGLVWQQYWMAPAQAGTRQLDTPGIVALVVLVGIAALSGLGRRTSLFLYAATWLFLLPFVATVGRVFGMLDLPLRGAELARLLAALGVGYLALAYALDGVGGHYAKPVYLAGYALSVATMVLSAPDRALNVQVVGLSVVVYAASARLVHTGRHRSFLWVLRQVCGPGETPVYRQAKFLFVYLASWLFPAWLLLAMSLRWPPPGVADYGLALAVLAPMYAAVGWRVSRRKREYRWPWYLAGYALSAVGPLVAISDPRLRLVALTVSVALYLASAMVSRRSAWLYLVAPLTPVLAWQALARLGVDARLYGLAFVLLAFAYGAVGAMLHHRSSWPRRLLGPIGSPMDPFARPFFLVTYALCALGLALVAGQGRGLALAGFGLAAALFGVSAYAFRQGRFGYLTVGTAAVAYVVGMTLTPMDARGYGLGLLPGIFGSLALAEVLRRGPDAPWAGGRRPKALVDRWATPFHAAAYAGTVAMPAWSVGSQGIWTASWWAVALVFGVSVALFRRPAWLYPALAAGLVGWLAGAYHVWPELSALEDRALLGGAGWLLLGLALVLGRGRASQPTIEALGAGGRILAPRWRDPLAVCGWLAVAVSVGGSVLEPRVALPAAASAALLVAILATLWRGRAEAWASLGLAGVAYEEALVVWVVPMVDQPQWWAVASLGVSLLAIVLRRTFGPVFAVWIKPLSAVAIPVGAGAVLWAVALQIVLAGRDGLQSLSATVALTGLMLIAHGFEHRSRFLGYGGVGLLDIGYMLQLVFFEVGQPQAFALPTGLYLLGIAYLEWRRGTEHHFKYLLEETGLTILLGVTLLQALGFLGAGLDRYTYATGLLLESAALFGLGAALHWRRSFFGGALALVLDVAILLADPLRAMNTWYLMAVIGLAMIAAVVFIEQRRQRIPFWLNEWRLRLEAWD